MTSTLMNLHKELETRRRILGMSCSAVAKRTALSLRTVQRVLSGREKDPGFQTIATITNCLGMSIDFKATDSNDLRRRQAEHKANQLVSIVQGSSALEAQGVSDDTIRRLKEKTVHELLAGSSRKLWK
ncbi:MAG TPA: hypothetical protein VMG59_04365 [Phycisphaerae bacterium]|nr:hypothetical protein [Phycisphaerae bacterium]